MCTSGDRLPVASSLAGAPGSRPSDRYANAESVLPGGDPLPSTRHWAVASLAPDIVRQRLLIEGYFEAEVDESRIDAFLQGLAADLGLRAYGRSAIFSPGGQGRQENQGYDAFLPLIDSGISLYVWTGARFVAVVLFTCKAFDEQAAIAYTTRALGMGQFEAHAF